MTDWRHKAACRGEDPELFFPIGNAGAATQAQVDEAKAVCARCSVRSACLNWALDNGEDAGVWGGSTEVERRQIRRANHTEDGTTQHNTVAKERVAALIRGEQAG